MSSWELTHWIFYFEKGRCKSLILNIFIGFAQSKIEIKFLLLVCKD